MRNSDLSKIPIHWNWTALKKWLDQPVSIYNPIENNQYQEITFYLKYFNFHQFTLALGLVGKESKQLTIRPEALFDSLDLLIDFVAKLCVGKSARYAVHGLNNNDRGLVVEQILNRDYCRVQLVEFHSKGETILFNSLTSAKAFVKVCDALVIEILNDQRLVYNYLNPHADDDDYWDPIIDKAESKSEEKWNSRFPEIPWDNISFEQMMDFEATLRSEVYIPTDEEKKELQTLMDRFHLKKLDGQ